MVALRNATLIESKAAVARACIDSLPRAELGEIVLRESQRFMIARACRAITRQGGALIADDVGRGKTYVALGIAQQWRAPLVVGPAALRSAWLDAASRANVAIDFASTESFSRTPPHRGDYDGVIVDESHHFRNPETHRYNNLAAYLATVPVVMLSATPLQNRDADLAAQVALFHGERAFLLSSTELATLILRGPGEIDAAMPSVAPPLWIDIGYDETEVLEAIVALPSPARPLDGGDAGVLRSISLVRAWTSSRAALGAALRARRRLATAIEQGVEAGRLPTRQETRAWIGSRDAVQLGFASMLIANTGPNDSLAAAREMVRTELRALEGIERLLAQTPDSDVPRAARLRVLRSEFPAQRILVFTEFASTARRLFEALHADGHVGLSTARYCRIASGLIGRDELLARFAPVAQRSNGYASHEDVTLLLTTDLLSEGVNLQDASIVVHLDLPWNPARLTQRVGRVRRPGGNAEIHSFLFAPPAATNALLRTQLLLRSKLTLMEGMVGRSFDVLPALIPRTDDAAFLGCAEVEASVLAILSRWSTARESTIREPRVACVRGTGFAWLAALSDGTLLTGDETQTCHSLERALSVATLIDTSVEVGAEPTHIRAAYSALNRWLAAREIGATCGLDAPGSVSRRLFLTWLDALGARAARHHRAQTLAYVRTLREALKTPLPLGAERALVARARVDSLRAAVDYIGLARRPRPALHQALVALIVVVPDQGFVAPKLAMRPRGPTAKPDVDETSCTEL